MNVLILGSGGREHALAWKIAQSQLCDKLYAAPGNPGTAQLGQNLDVKVHDFEALAGYVSRLKIDLVVVGPEVPLVLGITDFFRNHKDLQHVMVIGPGSVGAQLEGSKDFAKAFMQKYNIPTAAYKTFTRDTLEEGKKYLASIQSPYVLKADGLAAGKGVVILNDLEEAKTELEEMLAGAKFGEASQRVVIEEFLDGIELSVFALTDGKDYVLLPHAKDYKRVGAGDTGLNTGGMGAVSPVPFVNTEFMQKIINRIVEPTIQGIYTEKMDYVGFVYMGLIKVGDDPYVIEYNARLGDPEAEVILPRIKSDFLDLLIKAGKGELQNAKIEITPDFATTVIMVSGGYPGHYVKGKPIQGLDKTEKETLFHAGTREVNHIIETNGGRVLAATATGKTLSEALKKSYALTDLVQFEGKYFRPDIGKDLMSKNAEVSA